MSPTARSVRPPAVAGLFYPADPGELRAGVEKLLTAAPEPDPGGPPAVEAIIAPHAGYAYSGPVAATAFRALAAGALGIRRIVLIGPAHRVPLNGLALPGSDAFATPLGEVAVDGELVEKVRDLPQVTVDTRPHGPEHSLEVELPFLQVLFPEASVLPLVVGEASADDVAQVLERSWVGPETRLVVSSDLSHYLPDPEAKRIDRDTAERILALEGPIPLERACGAIPVSGLLVAARSRGLRARLLDLRTSGDTAGDRRRVVGYGAFAFA